MQMNQFEEIILKKFDDISQLFLERFAMKEQTIEALKFIEERIENIEGIVTPEES